MTLTIAAINATFRTMQSPLRIVEEEVGLNLLIGDGSIPAAVVKVMNDNTVEIQTHFNKRDTALQPVYPRKKFGDARKAAVWLAERFAERYDSWQRGAAIREMRSRLAKDRLEAHTFVATADTNPHTAEVSMHADQFGPDDAVTVNLNIHHITEAQAARVLDLMQEIVQ